MNDTTEGNIVKDALFFNAMLTPKIITLVYWVALVLVLFSGIGAMFAGGTFASFLAGLGIIVGGVIGARVWCELVIVIFKIHESLRNTADRPQS